MKKILPLCAVLLASLAGCGSNAPLTEAECRQMLEQQIDVSLAGAPEEERKEARQFLLDASAQAIAQCAAGDSFERDDYDCVMAADSIDGLNACMVEAVQN